MQSIRISRLIKCLLAAGCAVILAASASSGDGAALTLLALAGYSIFTMWVYMGFPSFAAGYANAWKWASIFGMLGSVASIVAVIVMTVVSIAAGVVVIPIIFVATLFGIIFKLN